MEDRGAWSGRRALRALYWLALLIPGVARGVESPYVADEPVSAGESYGGFQRKLLRIGTLGGGLAAIHVSETDQLEVSISNDAGLTWTATTISDGPYASVTAYAWSAVVDPGTNDLHLAFSRDASGAIGDIGYAMGTYASSPAGPAYTWTITGDVIGPVADLHLDVMALGFASVGGIPYLDRGSGRSASLDGSQGRMKWSFRRAAGGLGEWWTVPGGLGRKPDGVPEPSGATGPRPAPLPSLIDDEADWWWPEEWDTGGHFYVLAIDGASTSTAIEEVSAPAGAHDLIVPAGTALTFAKRYRVSRFAAAAMERREAEVKSAETASALAAAQALESARAGLEQLASSGGDRQMPSEAAAMAAEMRTAEEHLQGARFRSSSEHSKLVLDRLAVASRKIEATRRDALLAYVKVLTAGFDMMQGPGRDAGSEAGRIITDGRRVLSDAQAAIRTGDLEAADKLIKTGAELLRKAHASAGDSSASEEPSGR